MWREYVILNNMYNPKFTITPEITNWIAQIEAIKQKIDRSKILPVREISLRHRAAIESAHSSTSIEGNPLNRKQVAAALAGKMNAWEKKVIEVTNYKKAWDWISERSQKKSAITIADILKLHRFVASKLLPENKVGAFRLGPIYIVDIIRGEDVVRYTGPDISQIKSLLLELLAWVKKQKKVLHPVLLAGIIHYEFVSIHPFSDGNGRVTRLLVKLLLDLLDYDFRGCLVLDIYYWQNTNQYYQNLNQADNYSDQRKADLSSWLAYFTEGFYLVSKDLERKINLITANQNDETITLNNQEMQILDFVNQFGQINLSEALGILQIPERTIQRRLKKLVDKNILEVDGKGKNTIYRLNKIDQR